MHVFQTTGNMDSCVVKVAYDSDNGATYCNLPLSDDIHCTDEEYVAFMQTTAKLNLNSIYGKFAQGRMEHSEIPGAYSYNLISAYPEGLDEHFGNEMPVLLTQEELNACRVAMYLLNVREPTQLHGELLKKLQKWSPQQ